MPSGAPTAAEFQTQQQVAPGQPPYRVVQMDTRIAQLLSDVRTPGFAASYGGLRYRPSLVLRPGDTISTTIFDFAAVPLFGAAGASSSDGPAQVSGHTATIPNQVVELDGTVVIPFAGNVKVGGLTPLQAGHQIEGALKGAATDAHAVVTLLSSAGNAATAGGDLQRPGIVPLTIRGERVLDVVAAAGGAKYPARDCDVQLIRRGRIASLNLQRLVDSPEENVTIEPGDNIFVSYNPRSFSVLGAALKVNQYNFDTPKVTLAEALARAGGPNGAVANVSDVYLLRSESLATLERIAPSGDPAPAQAATTMVPVAYHIDLRRAEGYFQSQALQIRDKDLVVVANADSVQLQEIMAIVRNFTGVAYDLRASVIGTSRPGG
ncbi:MAG: polysaccharide export protein [Hyphomicrobiales bacterium]|nr:polysaccharide export protein [Hyphomicrobiales bacterium]